MAQQKRPTQIALPVGSPCCNNLNCDPPQGGKSHASPRPPIPPRRHTLAEICRYADEQCAYIEWMTRELEAEEAVRSHSMPTTPAGAITNPFNGLADMWWRPTFAKDMYGKSALRCQQEKDIAKPEQVILAANRSAAALGTKQSRKADHDCDRITGDVVERSELSAPIMMPLEECVANLVQPKRKFERQDEEYVDDCQITKQSISHQYRMASQWFRTTAVDELNDHLDEEETIYEGGKIFSVFLKLLAFFVFLPLLLLVVYCRSGVEEEDEEYDECIARSLGQWHIPG